MRLCVIFIILFSFSISTEISAKQKLNDSYTIITRIKSPLEMISDIFPKRYSVPVTLSGSIADEIASILDTINIDKPLYSEYYDRKNGFVLSIINEQFPSQTREMISGILNPIDMTGVILNYLLKYRETDNLIKLQKETTINTKNVKKGDSTMILIEIKPKGTRFCYEYKDFGAYLHESWLSEMSITIDSSTMVAQELSIVKHLCDYNATQQKRPAPKKFHQLYKFTYAEIKGSPIPSTFDLYIDSQLTLSFSASYREFDKYTTFDRREITYFLNDKPASDLIMKFMKYDLSVEKKIIKEDKIKDEYAKNLKRAAAYSRKATEALNSGRIQKAVQLMQMIIDNYPHTPQAVEAKKLLSGLQYSF